MKRRLPRCAKKLTLIGVHVDDEWLQKLEWWIAEKGSGMSRPEAIRRLVEIGLRVVKASYSDDRKLMELANRRVSIEVAAAKLGYSERVVAARARKLGISLKDNILGKPYAGPVVLVRVPPRIRDRAESES